MFASTIWLVVGLSLGLAIGWCLALRWGRPTEPAEDVDFSARSVPPDSTTELTQPSGGLAFRSLAECSSVGVFRASANGQLTWINPRYQEITGATLEQVQGSGWLSLVHADERNDISAGWFTSVRTARSYGAPFRLLRPTGELRWVRCRSAPLFSSTGVLIGHVGTIEDFTEQRQATDALRERERMYRLLADHATDLICRHAPDGTVLFASHAARKLLGVAHEDLLGKPLTNWFLPEHAAEFTQLMEHVQLTCAPATLTVGCRHATGRTLYLEVAVHAVRDPANNSIELQSSSRDVTARRLAEERLQASEERRRLAEQAAVAGSWLWEVVGNRLLTSSEYAQLHGIDAAGNLSWDMVLECVHDEDRNLLLEALQTARTARSLPQYFEYRVRHPERGLRWLGCYGRALSTTPGTFKIVGLALDVTERKQREAQLIEAAERLQFALESADLGAWEWEPASDRLALSPRAATFVRLTGESELTRAEFLLYLHPQDQAAVAQAMEHAFAGGDECRLEVRLRPTPSAERWLVIRGRRLHDGNHASGGRLIGTLLDNTARRQVEERLRLLQSAVEQSHDAVVITDAELIDEPGPRIVYVNEAFEQMSGYLAPECVGKSPRFMQGAETDRFTLDQLRIALSEHDSIQTEILNYHRNGTPYWTDLHLAPISDPTGRVTHFVSVQRDITDRKRAQSALEASERFANAIFERSPVGLEVYSPAGQVQRRNPAAGALVDAPAGLLGDCAVAALQTAFAEARAGAVVELFRQELVLAGRERVYYLDLAFFPVFDEQRCVQAVVMFLRDMTERVALEEQLRQSQKMEVTGQLAGGIAHDFNNLLTVVLNNLELVAEKVATDQQPAIADALTAGQRAADLTGQLLGFARRKALRLAPVPLPQLITETVRIMAAMLDKRHQLEPMLVPTLPAVWADSGSVQQILLNLCLNARDVLATGGRIRLTAELVTLTALPSLLPGCADRPAEGWPLAPADTVEQILGELVGVPALGPFVRVSVMDNGCGMNAALLRRIFEPFFTTKPVGKGTGLGLAMTAGLVQQHNGWLICQSCPGVGTRFDVYLPLAPAVIEPPAVTPMPPPPPEPAPATTVLVVDDEAPLRTIAERFLTAQGYQVLQAEDGLQAIELYTAERARIGLVLLDHMMPKLSGRDTLERLYALDPRVRVVLSSGYADEVDWSAHGVVGVLHKPYRLHEMAEVVRSALTAGT